MKTKYFTKNKHGKIEFTESELKNLLDEIYNDGYWDGTRSTYVYQTPYRWEPFTYTTSTASNSSNCTLLKGMNVQSTSNTSTPKTNSVTNSSTTYKWVAQTLADKYKK